MGMALCATCLASPDATLFSKDNYPTTQERAKKVHASDSHPDNACTNAPAPHPFRENSFRTNNNNNNVKVRYRTKAHQKPDGEQVGANVARVEQQPPIGPDLLRRVLVQLYSHN